MNWNVIQKAYESSFQQDVECQNWAGSGHDVAIRRIQEWNGGSFYLSPDINVRDIYLDYAVISTGWQKVYGIPILKDFIEPVERKDIRGLIATVGGQKSWRIYAGKDECQWMYSKILEILDVAMRYICSLYPRNCNNAFVLGDAGCWQNEVCSGHGGAHNNQCTVDLNYCTLRSFNMTHYRRSDMPSRYRGSNVNIWKDPFPQRNLKVDVFDITKNYVLYHLLKQIFPKSMFLTSVGINDYFKKIYGSSVLRGDDIEYYNHFRHIHLYLGTQINWNAKITKTR